MSDRLELVAATREEAYDAARQLYAHAQAVISNGQVVHLTAGEYLQDMTTKQRAFLHAAVFPQIAEQVRVEGTRFTAEVWKEHLRQLFLPDKWELRYALVWDKVTGQLRRAKRKTPHRIRQSTEGLGIRAYSDHIDRCIAHAVTEWGVEFVFRPSEREAVRYVRPVRKVAQREALPA